MPHMEGNFRSIIQAVISNLCLAISIKLPKKLIFHIQRAQIIVRFATLDMRKISRSGRSLVKNKLSIFRGVEVAFLG